MRRTLLALLCCLAWLPAFATSPNSSIVGSFQTPTGGAVVNATLNFALSQPAVVSGTGSIVPQTVSCYTTQGGNVVGVPDPIIGPVTSTNVLSGTLAAGTYYVKVTYYNASGESLPSPEVQVILSGPGTIIVNPPGAQPVAATGYKVYISSAAGSETLQGTVANFTSQYLQSSSLSAGSALPSSNSSVCYLYFSDTLVPTGTSYAVNMLSSNGTQMAGFPQTWCTYGGPSGTINISNGTPTGNCGFNGVYYPTPILATPPLNNNTQSVSGPVTVTTLTSKAVNNVQSAANAIAGSLVDCGAKVNQALANLGGAGKVQVEPACGVLGFTTAVTVGNNQHLEFLSGSTSGYYQVSAVITVSGQNASISGPPMPMTPNDPPLVGLQQASGANLAEIIHWTGSFGSLRDLGIDGNFTNNSSAGPCVLFSGNGTNGAAFRPDVQHVTISNCKTHGMELDTVPSAKLGWVMALQNQQDGVFCNGTSSGGGDLFVTDSEFENNNGNGLHLTNCPGSRINHSDFGANSQNVSGSCGLKVDGSFFSAYDIISNNQFGNEYRHDVCITGYSSGNVSFGNVISNNAFIGSGSLLANNTYDKISISGGGANTITGNVFSPSSGNAEACGIALADGGGTMLPNNIVPNIWNPATNTWATSAVCDTTAAQASGMLSPIQGTAGGQVLLMSLSPPVIASGFGTTPCIGAISSGTTCTAKPNGTESFAINVGGGGSATSGVLTVPSPTHAWIIHCDDNSTPAKTADMTYSGLTGTSITISTSSAWAANDILLCTMQGT